MRVVIGIIVIIVLSVISKWGISPPQRVLAIGGPKAIPTSAGVPPTPINTARTSVANAGGYKLTQTALVLTQSALTVTVTASATAIPTETVVDTVTATATTIRATPTRHTKPQRLPDTGSVDQSDIWTSTPIILLISVSALLSIGLYWQSTRLLK